MNLPTREQAARLLQEQVQDEYQRYHALMVATAMEGYARQFGEESDLWFVTGLLHRTIAGSFRHWSAGPFPDAENSA